jgi:hypothetical protein
MGALPQALEIIFEVQRKTSNKKNNKKKNKLSNLQNIYFILFYFFLSLWTPPVFKFHNFLISYSFQMI